MSLKLLSKQDIIQAKDRNPVEVSVPEWGGAVLVMPMTGDERDAFEASILVGKGKSRDVELKRLRAKLVALSIVDEHGVRMFGEKEVDELGKKSAAALQRVFKIAQKLNGLADEEVEELIKN